MWLLAERVPPDVCSSVPGGSRGRGRVVIEMSWDLDGTDALDGPTHSTTGISVGESQLVAGYREVRFA
jgi:hypothetical protein